MLLGDLDTFLVESFSVFKKLLVIPFLIGDFIIDFFGVTVVIISDFFKSPKLELELFTGDFDPYFIGNLLITYFYLLTGDLEIELPFLRKWPEEVNFNSRLFRLSKSETRLFDRGDLGLLLF